MYDDRTRSGILIDREPRPDFGPHFSAGSTHAYAWRGDAGSCGCGCGECSGDCGCGEAPFGHWKVVADGWESSLVKGSGASISDQAGCDDCTTPWSASSTAMERTASPPPPGGGPGPGLLGEFWDRFWVPGFMDPWGGGGINWRPEPVPIPFPPWMEEPQPACPAAIEFAQADTSEKQDGFLDGSRVLYPAGEVDNPKLIVFLPGRGGDPANHNIVLRAYRSAGFRTIGLRWNDLTHNTSRGECLVDTNGDDQVSDDVYNACLIAVRRRKFAIIAGRLRRLLLELAFAYPTEGWDLYLSANESEVDWRNIVLAGYSEGANEAAFAMRLVDVAGSILVSGGGDIGNVIIDPDENNAPPLADWVFDRARVDPDHLVGLRHVFERYNYTGGWTESGMHPETAGAEATAADAYGAFDFAYQLLYRAPVDDEADAHESTTDHPAIFPAHMYMACKAGGSTT